MSTPPSEQPRLPDDMEPDGETPDLDRASEGRDTTRIPADEADERIPDADE